MKEMILVYNTVSYQSQHWKSMQCNVPVDTPFKIYIWHVYPTKNFKTLEVEVQSGITRSPWEPQFKAGGKLLPCVYFCGLGPEFPFLSVRVSVRVCVCECACVCVCVCVCPSEEDVPASSSSHGSAGGWKLPPPWGRPPRPPRAADTHGNVLDVCVSVCAVYTHTQAHSVTYTPTLSHTHTHPFSPVDHTQIANERALVYTRFWARVFGKKYNKKSSQVHFFIFLFSTLHLENNGLIFHVYDKKCDKNKLGFCSEFSSLWGLY